MPIPRVIQEVVDALQQILDEITEGRITQESNENECFVRLLLPPEVSEVEVLDVLFERVLDEREDVIFSERDNGAVATRSGRCTVSGIVLAPSMERVNGALHVTCTYHEVRNAKVAKL